jgi:hypothetical protein
MASIRQNDNSHANAAPFFAHPTFQVKVYARKLGPSNLPIIPDASCLTIAPFDHLKFCKRYYDQHLFR